MTTSLALDTAGALDAFATWVVRTATGRDLSLTAAGTLATLDRRGPTRLSELAVLERVTQPSMTALVGRLERDGLAARTPDADDRRAVLVAITDAGRDAVRARRARRAAVIAEALERLGPDDRDAVAAAAAALVRLTEHPDADGGPAGAPHSSGGTTP